MYLSHLKNNLKFTNVHEMFEHFVHNVRDHAKCKMFCSVHQARIDKMFMFGNVHFSLGTEMFMFINVPLLGANIKAWYEQVTL